MGNENSTSAKNVTDQLQQDNDNDNLTDFTAPYDRELDFIRSTLKNDQEAFLLNNLMLCVQFFENYEREISEIKSKLVSRTEDISNTILSQSQKHILLPDVLQAQVSHHVKFQSTRVIDCETTIEPIEPVRMYVVLDNVKVNDASKKPDQVTSADSIDYKVHLDPSSNHGFVRIRCLDVNTASFTRSMTDLHIGDKVGGEAGTSGMVKTQSQTNLVHPQHPDDEGYQEILPCRSSERRLSDPLNQNAQFKHRRSVGSIPRSSRSSGYKSGTSGTRYVTDNDSDYATIGSSCTSVSSLNQANLPISSSEIPDSCFKKFVCTRDGRLYSEEAKTTKLQNPIDRRIRKAEQCQNHERLYLRKDKFRRYFENLFVNRLAKPLGFDVEDNNDVIRRGAIIHCYLIKEFEKNSTLIIPYEIVPSIPVDWLECCNGWLERLRRVILNSGNNDIWLTQEMIDKVKQLGCHIIPESCVTTRNTDPYHAVEWQITFPAAERYLETCLSHSKARIYLVALMLHRDFIHSADYPSGLTTSHIRSQLFWLLEKNYSSSMSYEYRAGESLREFLTKLYGAVSQNQPSLKDYFISRKNLFETIPKRNLHLIHKRIKRIIENPVMYLITSMKYVRYKPEFFPVFDYRRLFKLLTIHDGELVAFLNPALSGVERPMQHADDETVEIEDTEDEFDGIGRLGDTSKTAENQKNSTKRSRAAFQESVAEIVYECVKLHGVRLTVILDMFIKHFTKMAERCYHYGATEQTDVYLNQAHRLSIILSHEEHGKDNAASHFQTIKTLRYRLSRSRTQEDPSEIPERKNQPAFSVPLNQYLSDRPDLQSRTFHVSDIRETSAQHIIYGHGKGRVMNSIQEETTL